MSVRALKEELTRRGGSAAGFVEKADLVKAVVAARAAAAVQSHPLRPPVEPRFVNVILCLTSEGNFVGISPDPQTKFVENDKEKGGNFKKKNKL